MISSSTAIGVGRERQTFGPLVIAAAMASSSLWSTGCTDVHLAKIAVAESDRVAIRGEFCTSAPTVADYPVKILFVVDSSDSMIFSDPADMHVDAIEQVIDEFSSSENVSFGILRWGQRVVRELIDYDPLVPAFFTRDRTMLDPAFTRMRQAAAVNPDKYLGGTDYELALDAVLEYIQGDIATGGSALAQYYIEFMTDGMPQAGSADPLETKLNIVIKIEELKGNYQLRLDVISIVQMTTVPPEYFNLLPEMAALGGGSYVQLTSPATLHAEMGNILSSDMLLIEYDLARFEAAKSPRSIIVINRSARIDEVDGVIAVYPDSDGDGLVDPIEVALGTNPADPDTDGDGLSDLFEVRLRGEYEPLARHVPALSDEDKLDEDRDGLVTFVERRLGTDPQEADTDGDGVADGIEYREGTDPLVDDMRGDDDGDGVSNGFELRQHTRPDLAEPYELREERSYQLGAIDEPYWVHDGQRCYSFLASNVTLMPTQAAFTVTGETTPAGYNRIEIARLEYAVEKAELGRDVAGQSKVVFGQTWMIYRPAERYRDPWALELMVRDAHFSP